MKMYLCHSRTNVRGWGNASSLIPVTSSHVRQLLSSLSDVSTAVSLEVITTGRQMKYTSASIKLQNFLHKKRIS